MVSYEMDANTVTKDCRVLDVNLVDDGFWVRRAFHERSMLDCQSEQAQVDSDEVHLHVPGVTLDETLEKDQFSEAVHVQLAKNKVAHGFQIHEFHRHRVEA